MLRSRAPGFGARVLYTAGRPGSPPPNNFVQVGKIKKITYRSFYILYSVCTSRCWFLLCINSYFLPPGMPYKMMYSGVYVTNQNQDDARKTNYYLKYHTFYHLYRQFPTAHFFWVRSPLFLMSLTRRAQHLFFVEGMWQDMESVTAMGFSYVAFWLWPRVGVYIQQ